jgi:hypothetical protein
MAWDWKNKIGKIFGASTQPAVDATENTSPLASKVEQAKQQLANGTHRSYNRAELGDITESLRDLKDATRNNMVVLNSLMNAQPKSDEPAIKELITKMKAELVPSYAASENAMVELNAAANALEKISAKTPAQTAGQEAQYHLPVHDVERNLVIGLTTQLREIYTVHTCLKKMVSNTQALVTLHQSDRVRQALDSNNEKLTGMIPKLTGLTLETVGRSLQPAPAL